MITYFIDFIYGLSIVGILSGLGLVVDGVRRLTQQTSEPPRQSGPQTTWIYWEKPRNQGRGIWGKGSKLLN